MVCGGGGAAGGATCRADLVGAEDPTRPPLVAADGPCTSPERLARGSAAAAADPRAGEATGGPDGAVAVGPAGARAGASARGPGGAEARAGECADPTRVALEGVSGVRGADPSTGDAPVPLSAGEVGEAGSGKDAALLS